MKILILAPHQDDEVILCGSFLKSLIIHGHDVYVVFMTNGDYEEGIGEVRLKEALEVMGLYGVLEEHVIFMGYANEYAKDGPHIYNASEGELVYSQFGNCQTYGLPSHQEYCFQKHGIHHEYLRGNVISDLKEILYEVFPDIIFATDVEIHPDHKANSLFLDEVLGLMLKENRDFHPIVLKKPEYNTAWLGIEDYSVVNNPSAKKSSAETYINGQPVPFDNPYIRWNNRIRLPIDEHARTVKKENNIVYQALMLYKSQKAAEHFNALLNSDVVFWPRRTDSLSYRAKISVSSGEGCFLNDFKVADSSDIKRRPIDTWNIDASIWHPSEKDSTPEITIYLEQKSLISEIVIYQEFCPKSAIMKSRLIFDGEDNIEIAPLERRKPTVIRFEPRNVKKIEYRIEQCSHPEVMPGITEIEIYPHKPKKLALIKLMINGEFVYDYLFDGAARERIEVYEVYDDGSTATVRDWSKYHISVHTDKKRKKKQIEVIAKENTDIRDSICIWTDFHIGKKSSKHKRRIYFMGTPDYYNMGDHVIALATERLLKKMFPFTEIIDVPVNEFDRRLPELKRNIKGYDLIIMQGGGNMGNIYWTNESIRRKVIRNFPKNKIIVFPETIFYEENEEGNADFRLSQKIYRKAKNLTICAREKMSYEIMRAAYPNNKIILTPDIACSLEPDLKMERKEVKLFFRNDGEKSIDEELEKEIIGILEKEQEDYSYTSMQRPHKGHMGRANREETVKTKIREVASAKLVITDQLHAMILSVITGTPCLAVGKYNHKIASTYDTWFSELPNIELVLGRENLAKQIHRMLLWQGENLFKAGNKFEELITCLEENDG